MEHEKLAAEWQLLQTQFDEYEKYSLLIKLVSLIVFVFLWLEQAYLIMLIAGSVVWLQDAIWKTFQARIEQRMLVVEDALAHSKDETPMQFNSQWLAQRPSAIGLITEYIKSAIKPTVAFPHIVFWLIAHIYIWL